MNRINLKACTFLTIANKGLYGKAFVPEIRFVLFQEWMSV